MDDKNLELTADGVNRWWKLVRPYWHVLSFIVLMTSIATLNWAKIVQYDSRLVSLELWRLESTNAQNQQGRDLAVVKTQVEDIHEYLIPRNEDHARH